MAENHDRSAPGSGEDVTFPCWVGTGSTGDALWLAAKQISRTADLSGILPTRLEDQIFIGFSCD
jgi:hypothetical protein